MPEDLAQYNDRIAGLAIDQALRVDDRQRNGGAMKKGALLVGYARLGPLPSQEDIA